MDNIICVGIQCSFVFAPTLSIREKIFTIEKELDSIFTNGLNTTPNIKNNMGLNTPVIQGENSDDNYNYNISISPTSVEFIITSATGVEPFSAIKDFYPLTKRVYTIFKNIACDGKIMISGLSMKIFDRGVGALDGTEYIKNKFLVKDKVGSIYDVLTKYTYLEDDKFYVNVLLTNFRDMDLKQAGTEIDIDINDRYRYNKEKGQNTYSDDDVCERMKNIALDTIEKRIESLLS